MAQVASSKEEQSQEKHKAPLKVQGVIGTFFVSIVVMSFLQLTGAVLKISCKLLYKAAFYLFTSNNQQNAHDNSSNSNDSEDNFDDQHNNNKDTKCDDVLPISGSSDVVVGSPIIKTTAAEKLELEGEIGFMAEPRRGRAILEDKENKKYSIEKIQEETNSEDEGDNPEFFIPGKTATEENTANF